MAVTVERLIAVLEARFDRYEKALNRSLGHTDRTFSRIEQRGRQLESRMASIGGNIGRSFVGALAAGMSIRGFQRLTDSATRIDNALKVAGLSGEELERVYGKLRDAAIQNAAPIEALVELYSRAALVQKELGVSSEHLVGFSNEIAMALRVSGKSATESAGALLQLSQALGSGVVRAEEFNSMLEGAPTILQAAAAGIKEAEGSVSKLRAIVLNGELSSRALFDGFRAGASVLEDRLEGVELTASQAFGNLNTALIDAAREFENATNWSGKFAGGVDGIARAIAGADIEGFINKISDAASRVDTFLDDLANAGIIERFAEAMTGLQLTVGEPLNLETVEAQKELANLERQIGILRDRIEANKEMAIDTSEAESQLSGLIAQANTLRAAIANMTTTWTPQQQAALLEGDQAAWERNFTLPVAEEQISTNDPKYKAAGGKKKGGGRSREDSFAREIRQIQERTAAIQAETAAQAGLNPLIDDYGYALERARAVQELLSAAKKEGIAVTPELRAQIEALAEGYAQATVEANRLAEEQDRVRQAAEDMRALGKDVLGGFIRDLTDGKSAADALSNALGKIADKLLDIALNSVFDSIGGGLFSGLFGGGLGFFPPAPKLPSFDGGGHTGFGARSGGIDGKGGFPAILHPNEVVIDRTKSGGAGGITIGGSTYVINGSRDPKEIVAAIEAYDRGRMARLAKDIPELRRRGALK